MTLIELVGIWPPTIREKSRHIPTSTNGVWGTAISDRAGSSKGSGVLGVWEAPPYVATQPPSAAIVCKEEKHEGNYTLLKAIPYGKKV